MLTETKYTHMKKLTVILLAVTIALGCSHQKELASAKEQKAINVMSAINTLEDMKEWIEWDVYNGRIDSATGETLIHNIDETLVNVTEGYIEILETKY